jgi:hypothetical protein
MCALLNAPLKKNLATGECGNATLGGGSYLAVYAERQEISASLPAKDCSEQGRLLGILLTGHLLATKNLIYVSH